MQNKKTLKILTAERRQHVLSMLAQSMTETEIANQVGVHVSTISRDITYLKKQSQQFICDLAKSDLAFYYQQCLNTVEEVKRKAWESYRSKNTHEKDRIVALKLVKECEETRYSMLKDGPFLMNVKVLEEKLNRIESTREISK
jgi:IS30 family transposase